MTELSYFRQKRRDGAIRTGIAINDYTVLHSFVEDVTVEPDPALLWYVDVRFTGKRLPKEAQKARKWLLEKAAFVCVALHGLADELQAGMDVDAWPVLWTVPGTPSGLGMKIACSVTRRLEALGAAKILRGVADTWEESLRELAPLEAAKS